MRGKESAVEAQRFGQNVAARIRDVRRSRGESGTALAMAIGLSQQQLTKLERGECKVSLAQLWLIAEHYGVPVTSFVADVGARQQNGSASLHDRLSLELVRAAQCAPPRVLEAMLRVLHSFDPAEDPSHEAQPIVPVLARAQGRR